MQWDEVEAREDSRNGVYPLAFDVMKITVAVRAYYGCVLSAVTVDGAPSCNTETDDVATEEAESCLNSYLVVYQVVVSA
jgi:hypothetical protein